jgi:hypothetical protein
MGGRERNAAGMKSGDAVAHSAPVLTKPTSPELPVESRRLSSVQPKSGRGAGQSPAMLAAPIPLEDGDIAQLTELFLLLDAWDRKAPRCRLCLIACNSRQFDEVGASE